MRQEDIVALEIEGILREGYKDLSNYCGEYSNVIGVFYHELMIYLTNIYIISNLKQKNYDPINFPFVNSSYVNSPRRLNFNLNKIYNNKFNIIKQFGLSYTSIKNSLFKFLNIIKNRQTKKSRLKLGIAASSYFPLSYYYACFPEVSINIEQRNLLFLTQIDLQIEKLRLALEKALDKLEVKDRGIYLENFINFVKVFVSNKRPEAKNDCLIIGSPSEISSRITSANYKFLNKPVIAFSHGSVFTAINEPITGYGELSYCDYYIDFGNPRDISKMNFVRPLQKLPNIYYRSCEIIKRYYKKSRIRFRRLDKDLRIAYLPAKFCGNLRYGPFRDMNDNIYEKWQRSLACLDLNITYKRHPDTAKNSKRVAFKKESYEPVEEWVNNYDFYILDYLGTAYSFVAATDKPAIYFNLGLRNMSQEFISDFKKRFFWVDIDISGNLEEQIRKAFDDYNSSAGDFENNFSEKYSLNKDPGKNVTTVLKEVFSLIEKGL